LTRCSTLTTLRFPQLALRSPPGVRAGHGSLRARIAPRSALGTLPRSQIALCSSLSVPRRS